MSLHLLLAASNPAAEIGEKFGFNGQLFAMHFIGFGVVAFLLHRFAYGPILQMLDDRKERIAKSMADAERTKTELATAQVKVQEILTQAGLQAQKVIEESRAAAARVGEVERQKAIADAASIIAKAKQSSDAELARMKGELRQEFGRLVVLAASRATGDILTADQKGRLADDAVRQLAA